MSQNQDIHNRIDALEGKVDTHIHDGIDVWKALEALKNDITWVKRSMWALVGIGLTICGFLLKYMIFRLPTISS